MKRVIGFDGLRGVAVASVVAAHFSYGFYASGGIGVDLFFALSGYLITRLLMEEWAIRGRIDIVQFYARRALRLFPALACCLILAFAFWQGNFTSFVHDAIPVMFYYANFLPISSLGTLSHAWSLSLEEQFYLIFPWVLQLWLFKRPLRFRLGAMFLAVLVALLVRYVIVLGGFDVPIYTLTFARYDAILVGAILAMVEAHPAAQTVLRSLRSQIVGWLLLATFFLLGYFQRIYSPLGYDLYSLLAVGLIVAAKNANGFFLRFLESKPMVWLGARSYGIYLYHYVVYPEWEPLRVRHSSANLILITLARVGSTLLIAELSYRAVERPFLRLKRQYSRIDQTDTVSAAV